MMARLIRVMILLAVFIPVLTSAGCSAPAPAKPAPEVARAPDFQLPGLEGQAVSLSSLRGHPVLLNFWATWCGACQAEMPYLQEVFEDKELTDQGLVIVAIDVGEASPEVKKFVQDNGLSFQVLLDTRGTVAASYGVSGIPMTFFIDKDGIIKDRNIGSFANKAEIEWRLIHSILKVE